MLLPEPSIESFHAFAKGVSFPSVSGYAIIFIGILLPRMGFLDICLMMYSVFLCPGVRVLCFVCVAYSWALVLGGILFLPSLVVE